MGCWQPATTVEPPVNQLPNNLQEYSSSSESLPNSSIEISTKALPKEFCFLKNR